MCSIKIYLISLLPNCLEILQLKYTEDFEERKGKGSFPAMITPAYQNAKKANELASDVSMKPESIQFINN